MWPCYPVSVLSSPHIYHTLTIEHGILAPQTILWSSHRQYYSHTTDNIMTKNKPSQECKRRSDALTLFVKQVPRALSTISNIQDLLISPSPHCGSRPSCLISPSLRKHPGLFPCQGLHIHRRVILVNDFHTGHGLDNIFHGDDASHAIVLIQNNGNMLSLT